ncbi:MAG: peptidase domain-containing ABC transporter [Bacteroidota bacterium]
MDRFPNYRQLDQMDCGPTCLKIIAKHYGKELPLEFLRQNSFVTREGVSAQDIIDASEQIGFKAFGLMASAEVLTEQVPLPCIVHWQQNHFVVVYKVKNGHVYVSDPAYGRVKYTLEQFKKSWISDKIKDEGVVILLEPTNELYDLDVSAEEKGNFFKVLFHYLKLHKRLVFQLLAGLLVTSVINLIFPFATQAVVDYGIAYEDLNFIWIILAAQLTLFISRMSVRIIQDWLLLHLGMRINLSLLSDFLFKMMKLPISFFHSRIIGDLIRRVEDHRRIEAFVSTQTLNILLAIFSFLTFGIVLYLYNLSIFALYFVGTGLYILWVLRFLKRRAELDYKTFHEEAQNQSSLVQLLNGIDEIKLNNSERKRRWQWESIQVRLHRIEMKALRLRQMQVNGGMFISEMKNILVTFYAAVLVVQGELSLGTMLAIQYIITQLNGPILNFINFVQAYQDANLSMKRIGEIYSEPKEDEALSNSDPIESDTVKLDQFTFRYGGSSSPVILDNLSFEIPHGKVTAIVGVSGSGKTTLLKLLLKFYTRYQGSIRVGKVDLKEINAKQWRKQCGVVMQDGYIFDDTILKNITESEQDFRVNKERLAEAIRIANLEDFIDSLPSGLDTKLGADGINLSGGQNQRVLIARAVYKNPEYLFFDEATSSLDANNESVIMQNLEKFFHGKTVIVVAHRLSTVKKADQIVVLDRGHVIESGTHPQLIEEKGAYFELVRNQLELGE